MFEYFPGNYTWSAGVHVALMSGADLGELDRWLAPLRDVEPSAQAWYDAWTAAAEAQERAAEHEASQGFVRAAGERLMRAAVYHQSAERQFEPGPAKLAGYKRSLEVWADGVARSEPRWEHVEIPSPDGPMPAWIIPPNDPSPGRKPVMIFVDGFDATKEMCLMITRGVFERRNVTIVIVDTPGIGAMLRLHDVAARPDSEVPVGAVIDYLETRPDVDPDRIGVMGISLGGYYAPRAAAFDKRIKCVVAWGAILDWGATWQKRWATRSPNVSVPWFQLPWVMGTETMEEALERVKQWTLVDVWPVLTAPLLIIHGGNDRQISLEDATKAFELAGSEDKTMVVFSADEGGAEHCQVDSPLGAREVLGDWCAERLGAGR